MARAVSGVLVGLAVLAGLVGGLLAVPSLALGSGTSLQFGTTRLLGQDFEHERITRAALACAPGTKSNGSCFEPRSIAQLAGEGGTFGGVGAPDIPPPESAPAHCDDADYLNVRGYPHSLRARNRAFRACRTYMTTRWFTGIRESPPLLDASDRIIPGEVDLSSNCTFLGQLRGRAKCNVFDRFGRALHAIQDFYAHSNWADQPRPRRRIGINNPPGLNRRGLAPLLDMRLARMPALPVDLTTGCFEIRELFSNTAKACRGRIRHKILNKDNGSIRPAVPAAGADPNASASIDNSTGVAAGASTKPRGRIRRNFQKAVLGAIRETKRQWDDFRFELIKRYGAKRATLMICALTRDDPVRDCQGRKVAIVIDSSGSNTSTDPNNLRIAAGMTFNARLVTAAQAGPDSPPDRSAIIDFDSSASVVSALADPSQASFAGIDSSGGTDIASGVNLAIDELTRDPGDPTAGRSGIVVLTDGQDSDLAALLAAINRARDLEIRVSFGFLAPPANPVPARTSSLRGVTALGWRAPSGAAQAPPPDLVAAILETGGFYGTIDSPEAQDSFIEIVESHGTTSLDDPNGAEDGGALESGVDVSGLAAGKSDTDTWTFTAAPGRLLAVRLAALAGQELTVSVRDATRGSQLLTGKTTNGEGNITGRFRRRTELEIDVKAQRGQSGPYTVGLTETGVDLRGTRRAERLRCSAEPTYVLAAAGNDRVTCRAGNDMIVGGPGADRLNGGKGDDIFPIARRDLRRGVERINGGAGADLVEFAFRKPRGLRCAGRSTIVVAISRRSGWILKNVETVTFNGRRC